MEGLGTIGAESCRGNPAELICGAISAGVVLQDRSGAVRFANDAARRLLGLDEGAAPVGSDWPVVELLHEDRTPLPPETHPALLALATGTDQPRQVLGLRKGEGVTWLEVEARVLRDEATGQIDGVVTLLVDVTARVKAEVGLKESERHFRELAENWPDEVARYDQSMRRVYVNPYMASNIPVSNLLGRTPAETFPDSPLIKFYQERMEEVLRTGEAVEFDMGWGSPSQQPRYRILRLIPERDADGRAVGVFAVARDVSAIKRSEEALLRVNRALKTLSLGNRLLVRVEDEADLVARMCENLVVSGGHSLARVTYAKPARVIVAAPVDGSTLPDGMAFAEIAAAEEAARGGGYQLIHDIGGQPYFVDHADALAARGCRSGMVFALRNRDGVMGALAVYSSDPASFDDDEVALLEELAEDLAFGINTLRARIEREHTTKHLQDTMEATIQSLAGMVEMRDPYTAGHQRRVATLAAAIGRELGLDDERTHWLYLAAVVHDIGKIAIPAEILSRPGRLTPVQFELIKTHVDVGYEILKGIDFPWPIAEVMRQHHERLDGSGYPLGVSGDAIHFESRILAVSDVVEAMASHRPYRPGLGIEAAIQEVQSGRGRLYDPVVVDACARLFAEGRFSFG